MVEKYEVIPEKNSLHSHVAISSGKFGGITVKFGKVKFSNKENSDGTLTWNFEYTVIYSPIFTQAELDKSVPFRDTLSAIILDVLETQLADGPDEETKS